MATISGSLAFGAGGEVLFPFPSFPPFSPFPIPLPCSSLLSFLPSLL